MIHEECCVAVGTEADLKSGEILVARVVELRPASIRVHFVAFSWRAGESRHLLIAADFQSFPQRLLRHKMRSS